MTNMRPKWISQGLTWTVLGELTSRLPHCWRGQCGPISAIDDKTAAHSAVTHAARVPDIGSYLWPI